MKNHLIRNFSDLISYLLIPGSLMKINNTRGFLRKRKLLQIQGEIERSKTLRPTIFCRDIDNTIETNYIRKKKKLKLFLCTLHRY